MSKKIYLVTVDMGYGHQRAIYPLKKIGYKPEQLKDLQTNIITANNYPDIPKIDRKRWQSTQKLYEVISRANTNLPVLGPLLFKTMDYFQRIEKFYPRRDLSRPSWQLISIYKLIKHGWGKHLIKVLNQDPKPLLTSFFTVAFFAEEHKYKGDIYCLCTDTDVSRAWAPLKPKKSRIKYLAPNRRVKERLKLYGVKDKNIFITGFPLPLANIGLNLHKLKSALGQRIVNLDHNNVYQNKYHHTLKYLLGDYYLKKRPKKYITISFAVGGAGAQREIGAKILISLRKLLLAEKIKLNLIAGVKKDINDFYLEQIKKYKLKKLLNKQIKIVFNPNKDEYFELFNKILLETDILWTKPSELSFYTGLGLPIIMAPTLGSQEVYNRQWLYSVGGGVDQKDPKYCHEWLIDWLNSGWLAQAALSGFLNAPHHGVKHIEKIILNNKISEIESGHLLL